MCQPPAEDIVREMLGPLLSEDVDIDKVQLLPSDRPLRVHQVLLSDGRTLHLVLPPVFMWRPLRAEQDMLASEAVTVRWVRQALARGDPDTGEKTSRSPLQPGPAATILPLVPNLLRRGQESQLPDSSFAVYEPIRGTSLSLLPTQPTPASQREIDRQLGGLFRSLATLTAPTNRFGPLAAVIGGDTPEPAHPLGGVAARLSKGLMEGGLSATGGAGTWSVAFHSMLEGVLRDGEDMAVVIPYPTIRKHFRRLGYLLDEITIPRLVVVEGAGEANVLVAEEGEWKGDERDGAPEEKGILKLTGLRDWSSAIFGDPLLATIFSDPVGNRQPPSSAFLEGFNAEDLDHNSGHDPGARRLPYPLDLDHTIIQGVDTAWIRILFYKVYHAVTRIVREFYRPRPDSSARELEARRQLNGVLAKLAEVSGDAKKRHPRPTGEMSPAKRPRAAGGGQ
ncbi:uncharacterized protein P884DRAFT_297808 [Thermothelomyces heterothallicus CBS 202.75]|uniref:uncharacterized protein n=1 Tax=Thermothelomyces heterothallicus CBS 202.75 TaxID=1149848 RepID=UPI003743A459